MKLSSGISSFFRPDSACGNRHTAPKIGGMTTGYIPTLAQVDELHRKIAQSQAAYDLIHGHCVVVADIARRMARRQNALFTRRCTLPDDAPEKAGDFGLRLTQDGNGSESFGMLRIPSIPSSDGLTGGTVPPRLIDEHLVVIGGLLHDIGTYFLLKQDGSDGGPLKFDGPNYVRHGLKGYEYLLNEGVDESIAQFARNHTGVGLTKEAVESQGLPLPPADYVPMNLEQEVVMVADKYNSKSIPPKFLTAEAYARKAARFGESNRREWLRLLERYGVLDVTPLAEQYHMRIVE